MQQTGLSPEGRQREKPSQVRVQGWPGANPPGVLMSPLGSNQKQAKSILK